MGPKFRNPRTWLYASFALCLAVSCGMESPSSDDLKSANEGATGGTGGQTGGGTSGSGGVLPPEVENESYTAPAVSGHWIWTANPASGRVALIDALSTRVTTANAGLRPTYLASLEHDDENDSGAVVINVGSQDVSVFHSTGGTIDSVETVPLGAPANRITMSRSSSFALAWSDAALVPGADATEGMQDVTVIDLSASPPKTKRLSVGYRPNRVFVSDDERRAYVVSEPTVSVIRLGGSATGAVLRDVEITSNPTEAPNARDVTVTPDGALFFVRRENSPNVEVVSLEDDRHATVVLPGPVTDLDLAADGRSAFAVVRGHSEPPTAALGAAGAGEPGGVGGDSGGGEGGMDGGGGGAMDSIVAVLPVPAVLDAPFPSRTFGIEGVFGSIAVSPAGDTALLYTTAAASDRVVVLDTKTRQHRTVAVQAQVSGAVLAPDGAHAVVLLGRVPGSVKPAAFSVVPLKSNNAPRLVGTDAPPASVAIGETSALVTVTGPNLPSGVYLVHLPELSRELIRLASVPLSAALMPDVGRGFVAQSHPEGRITFVDLVTGAPRTITGFELGAKVVTGD
ncbi:MAG TPA: hypothetical protein VF103_17355 [Polyangiaceae bacterium]